MSRSAELHGSHLHAEDMNRTFFWKRPFPLTTALSPVSGRGRENYCGTVTPGSASLHPGLSIFRPRSGAGCHLNSGSPQLSGPNGPSVQGHTLASGAESMETFEPNPPSCHRESSVLIRDRRFVSVPGIVGRRGPCFPEGDGQISPGLRQRRYPGTLTKNNSFP